MTAVLTPVQAQTRPDRWRVIPHGTGYRVGRTCDASGSIAWHRGRRRRMLSLYGVIITFRKHAHAEARAYRLNVEDCQASGWKADR